jgi:hypothetical protein
MSVEFTQTTLASRATDIDLFAFGEAAITAAVARLRDNNVETSTVFSVSAEVARQRNLDADADAIFESIVNGLRSRATSIGTQAAFSLTAGAGAIKNFSDYLGTPNRTAKTITATGNVFLDNTQSQFGGRSARFDGTNDRLSVDSNIDFAFGTGAWTIELWVRLNQDGSNQSLIDLRNSTANQQAVFLRVNDNNDVELIVNGAERIVSNSPSELSRNVWYHVAVTRTSLGVHRMFINGVQQTQTWNNTTAYTQGPLNIGERVDGGNDFNGWMDDVRIIKGSALYTSNFTAPTSQLTNVSGTVLLLNMNLVTTTTNFVDTVGTTFVYQPVNYPSVGTVSAQVNEIVRLSAGLSSQFTQSLVASATKPAAGSIQSTATLTAQVFTTKDIVLSAFTNGALTAAADRSRDIESQQSCESAVSADIIANYNPSLAFSSSSSLSFLGGIVVSNSALLESRASLFASRNFGGPRPRNAPLVSGGLNTDIKKFGAASFDGVAQFMPGLSNPVPVPTSGQSFVFEWWQYDYATELTGSKVWWFYNDSPRGPLRLRRQSNTTGSVVLERFISSPDNWSVLISGSAGTNLLNQWAHYLIVRDSSRYSLYINGVRRATTTTDVNINFTLTESRGYSIASDSLLYIDDLSFHIGTTLGYNPNSESITVPTAPRQNTNNTVFLYHFDENINYPSGGSDIIDDVSFIQTFAANLQSTATLTAAGGAPVRYSADLTAQTQLSAVASKNSEIILSAFSDAALTADIGKTIQGESAQSSEFTQATQAVKQVFADLAVNTNTEFTLEAVKTVSVTVSTDSVATQLSAAAKVGDVIIDLDSQFAQTTVTVKTVSAESAQATAFQLTGDGDLLVDFDADLSAVSNTVIDAIRIRSTAVTLIADSAQSASPEKTASAQANLSVESSIEAATPGSILAGAALLASGGDLSVVASVFRDHSAGLESELDQSTAVNKLVDVEFEIFVNTQKTVIFGRDRSNQIQTDSVATQLSVAAVTSVTSSQITAEFDLEITAVKITGTGSVQTVNTAVSADLSVIRTADSALNVNFELEGQGTTDQLGSADLSVTSSLTASVQKTTEIILSAFSDAAVTAVPGRTRPAVSNQNSETEITAILGRLIGAEIVTESVATQLTIGGQIAGGISLQVSASTLTITARVLTLNLFVYQIPAESRTRILGSENRNRQITDETRTYQVRR